MTLDCAINLLKECMQPINTDDELGIWGMLATSFQN
jgi:hypothetical protein